MPLIPRINLPGIINDIIGGLLGSAEDAINFIGQQMESLYSAIRGWLWHPLRWAINNALGGFDELIDAISGLPDDLESLFSKLDNLILEGVGLTAELFKTFILETAEDWIEDLLNAIAGWIADRWD